MNDYQWHNDDFQTNTTHGAYNEFTYETEESNKKIRSKKRLSNFSKKTVKLPVVILSVILAVAVTVSGYALISPMVKDNSITLQQLQGNVQVPETSTSDDVAHGIISSGNREVLTIPEIAKKVGPAVVGVVN